MFFYNKERQLIEYLQGSKPEEGFPVEKEGIACKIGALKHNPTKCAVHLSTSII